MIEERKRYLYEQEAKFLNERIRAAKERQQERKALEAQYEDLRLKMEELNKQYMEVKEMIAQNDAEIGELQRQYGLTREDIEAALAQKKR